MISKVFSYIRYSMYFIENYYVDKKKRKIKLNLLNVKSWYVCLFYILYCIIKTWLFKKKIEFAMKNDMLKSKYEIFKLNIFKVMYILCIVVSKNKFLKLHSISFSK